MRWLRQAWAELQSYRWASIVAWRMAGGRLYVFRDAPLYIVVQWAAMDADLESHAALSAAIRQADEELKLRMRQLNKLIDDMARYPLHPRQETAPP